MRNKLKQLLKKEGGFTLIELLAVIAILALIVAISIPLIGNVVADSKTETEKAQEELVIDAAQIYYTQKPEAADKVTVAKLIEDKYLEKNFKDTGKISTTTVISKEDVENGKLP